MEDAEESLLERDEKETERIKTILNNVYSLIRLVNKKDKLSPISDFLFIIKKEIEESPNLLLFTKEELINEIDDYVKIIQYL